MKRFIPLLFLAACTGAPPTNLIGVHPGMYSDEVAQILGAPSDQSAGCASYPYTLHGQTFYIHGYYENDQLVWASDDHRRPCAS